MKSKLLLTISALLLISATAFSQKKESQISSNEKIFGKNFINDSDIKGIEFEFSDGIYKFFFDTTTNLLTLQLRGISKDGKRFKNNGKISQYDIRNNQLLWSKDIAYQTSSLQQFSETMIYMTGNKSYCLDVYTGNNLWEAKNDIYFVNHIENIGIGYKFKNTTGYSNDLEGINLKSGRKLWKRELNREYGWNDTFYVNDSTLVVVAAGLHAINIHTGKGWDYNTPTGKKDYSGTIAANAAGAALGLLTGTFVISTGYDLVRDLVSNALVDSAFIYFASREQLVKINKLSGNIIWKYPFANDVASKSSLSMDDNTIYMVNKGFAFMGYRQLDFGQPFIAAFDRQTGKQNYLTLMDVKKDPILDYHLLDNEIYLIFKNRITKYNKETGAQIAERVFPKDMYGELQYFIGSQVYITDQYGMLLSLTQTDSTKVHVFTTNGKVLSIDNQLNILYTTGHEDLGIYYLRTKDYKFIAKGEKTLIINDDGEEIAEVEATSNAFLIDDILYDKRDNSFIAIDLKEIID
jgi:hypothetical protein